MVNYRSLNQIWSNFELIGFGHCIVSNEGTLNYDIKYM